MQKFKNIIKENIFCHFYDLGILVLRTIPSFYLFYNHGIGKLTNGVSSWESLGKAAMPLVGINIGYEFFGFLAASSEGVLSILVLFGFWARFSSVLISITMFFAGLYHLVAGESAELAFIYLSIYISIILIGPGRYSIDYYFTEKN